MPSAYEIDLKRRLVRSRAWGVLTHDDVMATRLEMERDPAFRPDFSQVYDFREVSPAAMSAARVRELAGYSTFGPGSRRAFVATHDVVYGLLRLYALEREALGGKERMAVFRSIEDAKAWLGLED